MLAIVGSIVAGLFLLYLGGEGLVRGAGHLALRAGISPLAIGLTVVAFGTSAPELVVSMGAAMRDMGDLAVGNVVGSNIANIALVLGVTALLKPVAIRARLIRVDVPLMIGTSLLAVGLLADGTVSRLDGMVLAAGLAGFIGYAWITARDEPDDVKTSLSTVAPFSIRGVVSDAALVVAGLVALAIGGHVLVEGAVRLASSAGMSEAVIGLTIVAVGTSLPELAASAVAGLRGEGDIALGNLIGSNVFNVLGVLGITAVVHPLPLGGVTALDLGFMILCALLLIPFMRTGFRLTRAEGAVLVAMYVAYVVTLIAS